MKSSSKLRLRIALQNGIFLVLMLAFVALGLLAAREYRDAWDLTASGRNTLSRESADAGTATFEREKDLSILEQLENELAELQAALERVDAGTYGIDEETGEPIDPERLDAFPTARTNVRPHDLRARDNRQDEIPEEPR